MKRSTKKSNSFLDFIKSHKKIMISLVVVFAFLGLFLTLNYGRYVKDIIEVYYLRTKNFYFNSDKLTIHGAKYEIEPWNGVDTYSLHVQMDSLLNSIKGTSSDVDYEVECNANGNIVCYFDNENSGITNMSRKIPLQEHKDSFSIFIKPNGTLNEGDQVSVNIVARSTYPYEEELSATFVLIVGNYGISYVIEDNAGDIYFDFIVTNTLPANSANINLKIKDTSKLTFDMTSSIFNNSDYTYETDGSQNINEVTFVVDPKSSMLIRFYKKDSKENYSHFSYDGESEVIEFNAEEIG